MWRGRHCIVGDWKPLFKPTTQEKVQSMNSLIDIPSYITDVLDRDKSIIIPDLLKSKTQHEKETKETVNGT